MLEVLEEECSARSIENIETTLCSWEDFDGKKSYDLAFTALSPAIRSRKDLLAMEKASRSRCCLVTSCPSDWMSLRNDLWEKVIGKFVPSDASSIRYPLNVLLDEGRSPILLKLEDKIETKSPSQNVIDHYLDYFQIFTDMTQGKVNIVREHILSQANDGYVISRGTRCLHLLCWKCK